MFKEIDKAGFDDTTTMLDKMENWDAVFSFLQAQCLSFNPDYLIHPQNIFPLVFSLVQDIFSKLSMAGNVLLGEQRRALSIHLCYAHCLIPWIEHLTLISNQLLILKICYNGSLFWIII